MVNDTEVSEYQELIKKCTYRKVAHEDSGATQLWFIVCDEDWRESIVCERMYEHVADWLLGILDGKHYLNNKE